MCNGMRCDAVECDAMCCLRAGGRIGLIDYGQSKQLPDAERLAFAALLLELAKGKGKSGVDPEVVARRLGDLGLRFERNEPRIIAKMAFGMFDTQTSHRCAPCGLPPPGICRRMHLAAAACFLG